MADIMKLRQATDKVAGAFGSAGVKAPNSEASSIASKAQNVKNYMDATQDAPNNPVAPPVQGDKLKNNGKFGDRGSEKRLSVDDMVKPLGSFKKGTPHVPKTGLYKLHEGEAVIPKENNEFSMVRGKSSKKPKKEIKEIRTRKSHDGKFIHEHHHTDPSAHPMEEHVSDNQDDMASHMMDAMGSPNPGEDASAGAPPDAGAPPAAGAAPPPMPGA